MRKIIGIINHIFILCFFYSTYKYIFNNNKIIKKEFNSIDNNIVDNISNINEQIFLIFTEIIPDINRDKINIIITNSNFKNIEYIIKIKIINFDLTDLTDDNKNYLYESINNFYLNKDRIIIKYNSELFIFVYKNNFKGDMLDNILFNIYSNGIINNLTDKDSLFIKSFICEEYDTEIQTIIDNKDNIKILNNTIKTFFEIYSDKMYIIHSNDIFNYLLYMVNGIFSFYFKSLTEDLTEEEISILSSKIYSHLFLTFSKMNNVFEIDKIIDVQNIIIELSLIVYTQTKINELPMEDRMKAVSIIIKNILYILIECLNQGLTLNECLDILYSILYLSCQGFCEAYNKNIVEEKIIKLINYISYNYMIMVTKKMDKTQIDKTISINIVEFCI